MTQPLPFKFQDFSGVQISDRTSKLKGGFVGIVQIKRIELQNTNQAGLKIFTAFDVVQSNNEAIHPVGMRYSWGQTVGATPIKMKTMQENMLKFTAAVWGIQTSDKDRVEELKPEVSDILNTAIQNPDQNQFVDRYVRVETTDIKTKEGGFDFVVHTWAPVG